MIGREEEVAGMQATWKHIATKRETERDRESQREIGRETEGGSSQESCPPRYLFALGLDLGQFNPL